MRHKKIRAQRHRANQLVMKRLNRPRAHHPVRRGQVNQVIIVNDHRPKPEFLAARAEPCRVHLGNARASPRPHPRAGRKNLQRIGAQLRGGIERSGDVSGNRSVNSDAKTAILPGRRLGDRFRFGTIFVTCVVGGFRADQWVSHSLFGCVQMSGKQIILADARSGGKHIREGKIAHTVARSAGTV